MASTRSTISLASPTSRRATTFLYYSGKQPSAVRYKNWKMYFAMVSDSPAGFINGVVPYAWTQVVNIKRDPFETYIDYPPLQDPASYNLEQVMQQVRDMKSGGASQ